MSDKPVLGEIILKTFVWLILYVLSGVAVVAQPELLTKAAFPASSASGTAVTGESIDWVLTYQPSAAGAFSIHDTLPAGLHIEPGTLQTPSGWASSISSSSGASVVSVQGESLGGGGTTAVGDFPFPTLSTGFGTVGGDGTVPVLYDDRVYALHHHQLEDGATLSCLDRASGTPCAGYPVTFSTTAGPASAPGLGNGDVSTLIFQEDYPIIAGRLYYAAQAPANYGIGCFDLAAVENCGYVVLGNLPNTGGDEPATFTMKQVANRLYTIDINHAVSCFDLDTLAVCPGYPVTVGGAAEGLTPFVLGEHISGGTIIAKEEIDGRIIYIMNQNLFSAMGTPAHGAPAQISCFDTLTAQRCADWTTISATNAGFTNGTTFGLAGYTSIIKLRSGTGTTTGFCAIGNRDFALNLDAQVLFDCYDLQGNSVAGPPGFTAAWPNVMLPFVDTEVDDRVYLGTQDLSESLGAYNGAAHCWDWSIGGPCPGFGTAGFRPWTDVNGGNTFDYGYVSDGTCMYGLGDTGYLWSFDPNTGSTPCNSALLRLEVNGERFYCDGQSHVPTWAAFELAAIDLTPGVEFSSLDLQIFDSAGSLLAGPTNLLGGSGQVDLSALPVLVGQSDLNFVVTGAALGTNAWDDNIAPQGRVLFSGDAAQMCFTTRVAEDCGLVGSTLLSSAETTPGGATASEQLGIVAGASCSGALSSDAAVIPSMSNNALVALACMVLFFGIRRIRLVA